MARRTAHEWGLSRKPEPSCRKALEWRKSLGNATQRTAWRRCKRGDWLFWQLRYGLTAEEYEAIRPKIQKALDVIVDRAVRTHALACGEPVVKQWAARWLSSEDRSGKSARVMERALRATRATEATWAATWAAADAAAAAVRTADTAWTTRAAKATVRAARAAAWAAESAETGAGAAAKEAQQAELLQQAHDIRKIIPKWEWGI